MNIYSILRAVTSKKIPAPIKLLGLAVMHIIGRRTIGIFLDPSMSCNLQCRMCYFSNPAKRRTMHGLISDSYLDKVEKALFHRALKLQIGCGAEPTLYPKLLELIKRGKNAGIPYISLTTNGQLLANEKMDLLSLVENGLNEITLSMHGTQKDTYEYLMPGAKYESLITLIKSLTKIKNEYPDFKIRVNYTVNSLNIEDLKGNKFWDLWDTVVPDILQLRPVQNMGDTDWKDFNLEPLKRNFDTSIGKLATECSERGITCISPTLSQLDEVVSEQDGTSSIIEDFTYCYVSPTSCYKDDFNPESDTYESYHKRKKTFSRLLKSVFKNKKARSRNTSKKLNYQIK